MYTFEYDVLDSRLIHFMTKLMFKPPRLINTTLKSFNFISILYLFKILSVLFQKKRVQVPPASVAILMGTKSLQV